MFEINALADIALKKPQNFEHMTTSFNDAFATVDHKSFSDKMMQGVDQANNKSINLIGQFDLLGSNNQTANGVEGSKSLSDHLFSSYQNAKNEYIQNIDQALSTLDKKEHVSKMDQQLARMELNSITNKNKILINGCEKTMETLNMLLRMQ